MSTETQVTKYLLTALFVVAVVIVLVTKCA